MLGVGERIRSGSPIPSSQHKGTLFGTEVQREGKKRQLLKIEDERESEENEKEGGILSWRENKGYLWIERRTSESLGKGEFKKYNGFKSGVRVKRLILFG